MKAQTLLLLLVLLAIFTRDIYCEKNENENEPDEDEADENEPDEDEGGHNGKHHKHLTKSGATKSASASFEESFSGWATNTVSPVSYDAMVTSASLPTASATTTAGDGISGAIASGASSVVSEASGIKSSVIGAASSWAASVSSGIPSASFAATSKPALPSVSAPSSVSALPSVSGNRPYSGTSVTSESSRIKASIAIAAVGVLAFLLTLS